MEAQVAGMTSTMLLKGAQLGYLTSPLYRCQACPVTHRGVVAEPPPPNLRALTPVFLTIQLAGGHIGLPILIATFLFSKTAKRHPTVVNFCVIWILYSIIYCLLYVLATSPTPGAAD